jgi:hypothetical protein
MKAFGVAAAGVLAFGVVVGALASTVSFGVETAVIGISPPTKVIETTAELHGSLAGGDFLTRRLEVKLAQSLQGSATGVFTTPATRATGYVVFTHICGALPGPIGGPPNPCQPTPAVPAGTAIWNTKGTETYVLLSAVTCFCGEYIPVRADVPGSAANTPAHTISLYVTPLGFTPFERADNPGAVSGGEDAMYTAMVTQADIDRVRSALAYEMRNDLDAALKAQAAQLRYVADAPTIQITGDASAGTHTSIFAMTATGSLTATAFSDADAGSRLSERLTALVPSGWKLVHAPSITYYELIESSPSGDATVRGSATGVIVKQFDPRTLSWRLRGLRRDDAVKVIEAALPGSTVTIRLSPTSIPWLPMNADHISFA